MGTDPPGVPQCGGMVGIPSWLLATGVTAARAKARGARGRRGGTQLRVCVCVCVPATGPFLGWIQDLGGDLVGVSGWSLPLWCQGNAKPLTGAPPEFLSPPRRGIPGEPTGNRPPPRGQRAGGQARASPHGTRGVGSTRWHHGRAW